MADGEKAIEIVQVAPAATLAPQVFVSWKLFAPLPVIPMEESESVDVPVFDTVTLWTALVVETAVTKLNEVPLKERLGDPPEAVPPPGAAEDPHPRGTTQTPMERASVQKRCGLCLIG